MLICKSEFLSLDQLKIIELNIFGQLNILDLPVFISLYFSL